MTRMRLLKDKMIYKRECRSCLISMHLKHQGGFTLPELMISTLVASIVFLGAGTLIVETNRGIKVSQQRQHMMDNMITVNMALLKYGNQAIGMRWQGNVDIDAQAVGVGANGDCFNVGTNCGRIRQYAAPGTAASAYPGAVPTPPVDTLAIFLRESRPSGVDGGAGAPKLSQLTGAGIFYQHQTSAYSGVLWITEARAVGVNQTLRAAEAGANKGSISFENIVDLQIANPDPPGAVAGTLLRGVDIVLRMRAFSDSDRTLWRFCRPAEAAVAMCQVTSPYSDVDRTIHLVFRNNILSPPAQQNGVLNQKFFERVNGALYFFDFNFPSLSSANTSEGM